MPSVEELIEPIRHSPHLVKAVSLLSEQVEAEKARRHQFYEEMTPEQKIEFIDGKVILHSPAKNRHLDATALLWRLISTYVDMDRRGTTKSEKCLCVFPRNDYDPDIAFFGRKKAADLNPDTLKFPPPDFVVEVLSQFTEQRDRGVKYDDYEANGVAEYWIIDPEEQSIEQYILEAGEYRLLTKSANGEISSLVIANFTIPIRAVFDETENLAVMRNWLSKD